MDETDLKQLFVDVSFWVEHIYPKIKEESYNSFQEFSLPVDKIENDEKSTITFEHVYGKSFVNDKNGEDYAHAVLKIGKLDFFIVMDFGQVNFIGPSMIFDSRMYFQDQQNFNNSTNPMQKENFVPRIIFAANFSEKSFTHPHKQSRIYLGESKFTKLGEILAIGDYILNQKLSTYYHELYFHPEKFINLFVGVLLGNFRYESILEEQIEIGTLFRVRVPSNKKYFKELKKRLDVNFIRILNLEAKTMKSVKRRKSYCIIN